MSQTDVIQRYRECDLFALACAIAANGDMDGLPTVLIESLALEVPSVSTQVTGVPEIIIHRQTGLCVAPHDAEVLYQALKYMYEHPDDAQRMAQRGRQLVETQFDRDKNAAALLALWDSLLWD